MPCRGTVGGAGVTKRGTSTTPLLAEDDHGRHRKGAFGPAEHGTGDGAGDGGSDRVHQPSRAYREPGGNGVSDAARISAPIVLRGVLRGVGQEGLQTFVKRIGERLGERLGDSGAGAAIDPRLFRLFGIEAVPAVVVVPGGVPPCTSRGCANDPAPPHDLITGNIGIVAALEAVAAEGGPGRETARRQLARLRGETQ